MAKAKDFWLTHRDPVSSIKEIPSYHRSTETHLLHGLAKFYERKDYISALQKIPRNIRLLYIHAFQSYLWNMAVSKRIELYGLQPIVGDLVLLEKSSENEKSVSTTGTTEILYICTQ